MYKHKKKIFFFLLLAIVSVIFFYYLNKILPKFTDNNSSTVPERINTSYYDLKLNNFKIPVFSKYGGIAEYGDKIVYVSGESDFYFLEKVGSHDNEYKFTSIAIEKIINNKDKFIQNNEKEIGRAAEEYFGVKDVLIENFDGYNNKLIFLSSLNYIVEKDCYNLSVYLAELLDEKNFKINNWKNIFSSKMCLSINLTKKPRFAAASAGGRLFKFDENNILLSIGDFHADGLHGPTLSQDTTNDYGKILKIDINDSSYKIFSNGHRNPQGLYIDKNNNIFSTEHGPEGGDELNLIHENKNYGWPITTLGTAYGLKSWPIDKNNYTHDNFTKPIFSWGNQFGVSNLIVYENNFFKKWDENLIISSLASKQLVRMVYNKENKSIIYVEYIPVKKRIRDIIFLNTGKIVLLTDRGFDVNDFPEIIIIDKFIN